MRHTHKPRLQIRLEQEATFRWGRSCPCCSEDMVFVPYVEGGKVPLNATTRGHDQNRNRRHTVGYRHFIRICRRCNRDQGRRSYREWADFLEAMGDPRAPHVASVADLFRRVLRPMTLRGSDAPLTESTHQL